VARVIIGAYRDLFAATAAAAGALTGLLFVAMSVASRQTLLQGPRLIRQIRGSAALLAFTNSLAISLFGLVPDINVGYPAVIVAVIGIFFTAAAIRSIVASRAGPAQIRSQTGLIMILLLICFTELIAGVVVLARPASGTSVQVIDYAIVTSLLVGIGRAWEFIGERDTGILASLGILAGHPAAPEAAGARDRVRPADDQPGSQPADAPGDPAASGDDPG
jgi:hypothetical protein